jgi:hypothetical protein
VRCREIVQSDAGKPQKQVRRDDTLLYTAEAGKLTRVVVGKNSENATVVRDALCLTKPGSPMCRRPSPNPSTLAR